MLSVICAIQIERVFLDKEACTRKLPRNNILQAMFNHIIMELRMKRIFLFLFVASVLPMQNIMAQDAAARSILAKLHRRIDNPNANFRQYISSAENGTYAIKGYTKGSTNDPDSYKGLLIPHFDINIFGDNLAYASGAAPGLPTSPCVGRRQRGISR